MKYKQGDKIKANGHFGSIIRYYSENMVEIRLPGGACCVDVSGVTRVITKDQYNKIHKDYRGVWSDDNGLHPEWIGKRTCFSGCIEHQAGTTVLVEDYDFIINN